MSGLVLATAAFCLATTADGQPINYSANLMNAFEKLIDKTTSEAMRTGGDIVILETSRLQPPINEQLARIVHTELDAKLQSCQIDIGIAVWEHDVPFQYAGIILQGAPKPYDGCVKPPVVACSEEARLAPCREGGSRYLVVKANFFGWRSLMLWYTPSGYPHANSIAPAQRPGALTNSFHQALTQCIHATFRLPFDLTSLTTCLDSEFRPWPESGFSRLRGVAAMPLMHLGSIGSERLQAGYYLPDGHIIMKRIPLREHDPGHDAPLPQITYGEILLLTGAPVLLEDVP